MIDDESLQMYVEESREHLEDIENDLLAIEEAGENIDEELVNKVFRAAHSIKGGAGFLGLTQIKELAHKIENVLDMIRNRQLLPTPDIVSVLLSSFDRLSELIENISESNEMDIAEHVDALVKITTAKPPLEEKNREMEESKTEGKKFVDETMLSVEQDLISTNADDLKQKLQATLVNNPSLLILDLSKVEHVDSIGIGLIIATFNTLKRQDGTLKLINLNSNLLDLFRTMRLDRHIEMEGTM